MAEKEYILRTEILEMLDERLKNASYIEDSQEIGNEINELKAVIDIIEEDIPAADVVEVVRCKDCVHAYFYKCKNDPCYNKIICEYKIGTGDENFYCSYGERKDDA